jgi:hypothetical protein
MKNTVLILALAATLFSCKKAEPKFVAPKTVNVKTTIDTIQDTIVRIVPLKLVEKQNGITNEIATKTLNDYFKSKGFLIQSEIENDLNLARLPKNKGKNVIGFIDLNLFTNQFGVITYFNAPVGAVGHCVNSEIALISSSDKGFLITNEGFLSSNFTIDSVKIIDNKPIIYSRDYDCYNHEFLKNYRVELKN